MSITAMPSLESPRFALPRQPGRVGAPAPEIGNLLLVASDVDNDGFSVNPDLGPMNLARRIALTVIIGWVAFGFSFVIAALPFHGLGWGPAVPAALAGGFFAWLGWRGMGTTKRLGVCYYVGDRGMTSIAVFGKRFTPTSTAYRDELVTTTDFKSVFINGAFAYTLEAITFWEPDGRVAGNVVGTYKREPDIRTLAVRATITAAGAQRRPAAQATLDSGGQVVFPIVRATRALLVLTGEALVLDASSLSYYKTRGSAPLRLDRRSVELALREGYVDLRTRDSSVVVGTFERARIGNWDLLEQLVGITAR